VPHVKPEPDLHLKSHHDLEALAKLEGVELQSETQLQAYALVHNNFFEYLMGLIIVANMVIIIIETDDASDPDVKAVHGWTDPAGTVVLCIFGIELGLRLFAVRMHFWEDRWNRFDFAVVVSDVACSIAGLLFGNVFPMSTLRVFRLAKLARISKVLRVFPELRQMMAGLVGSFVSIIWGVVLLCFVLTVWSIMAVQFIHPVNREAEDKGYYDDCERCGRAYSSVMSSMLTLSQTVVAGDSWGQVIPLIEYAPATALFFLAVYLSVGMAVMNLILGIVVTKAQEAHEAMRLENEKESKMKKLDVKTTLLSMCSEMDEDHNGELTKEEIEHGFENLPHFRQTLSEMDIGADGLGVVWTILDYNKTGTVKYPDFVGQIYKMQESDSQFMLAYIRYYICLMKDQMCDLLDQNRKANKEYQDKAEHQRTEALRIQKRLGEHQEQIAGRLSGVDEDGSDEKKSKLTIPTEEHILRTVTRKSAQVPLRRQDTGMTETLQAKDGAPSVVGEAIRNGTQQDEVSTPQCGIEVFSHPNGDEVKAKPFTKKKAKGKAKRLPDSEVPISDARCSDPVAEQQRPNRCAPRVSHLMADDLNTE